MYSAIILAAGSGTRLGLGYNKLLYKIDDKTIIEKTVEVFKNDNDCHETILVISKDDEMTMKELCIFTEGFREPVGGVNRYRRKIAISLPSRLCKESLICVVEYGCPVIGFELSRVRER